MGKKQSIWEIIILCGLGLVIMSMPSISVGQTQTGTLQTAYNTVITTNNTQFAVTPGVFGQTGGLAGLWMKKQNTGSYSSIWVQAGQSIVVRVNGICGQIIVDTNGPGVMVPLKSVTEWNSFLARYNPNNPINISNSTNQHVRAIACGAGVCPNPTNGLPPVVPPANSVICPDADQALPSPAPASRVVGVCNPSPGFADKCTFTCQPTAHIENPPAPDHCVPNTCATVLPPANAVACNAVPPNTHLTPWSYSAGCGVTPCTFNCALYYHWDGASCVPNTCSALLANASACNNSSPAVHNSGWVYEAAPCDGTSQPCHLKCNAYFHWNAAACVPNTCGVLPGNSTACNATSPAVDGTAYTYEGAPCDGTSQPCRFRCNTSYYWTGANCILNVCGALPANATNCNVNAPAVNGQPYSYTAACGATACTYSCNSTSHWTGASCLTNVCSGSVPANATGCNSNPPTTDLQPYSSVPNCGTTACTFACNSYYHWDGAACVANVCAALPSALKNTPCNANPPATNNQSYARLSSCGGVATPCTYQCTTPYYHWRAGACECDTNAECNDSNACTTDVCTSPGTNAALCSWTAVAPTNCVGSWGGCSLPCGGGTQTYTVTTAAACGGAACPYANGATQACNTQSCCTPESDATFCARYGKNCGSYTNTDNCGASRTANCGGCTAPQTCGGAGTANVCGQPCITYLDMSMTCGAVPCCDMRPSGYNTCIYAQIGGFVHHGCVNFGYTPNCMSNVGDPCTITSTQPCCYPLRCSNTMGGPGNCMN